MNGVAQPDLPATRAATIGSTTWTVGARRRVLATAIAIGVVASGVYLSWWVMRAPAYGPWLVPVCGLLVFYLVAQVYCAWYLYLKVALPTAPNAAPETATVDVLVPVYDEPYELVERTLTAAVAMRHRHTTYLLDDAHDARFAALAMRLGARYLTRTDRRDAKAGNVNAALARSDGEFVAVFDVDHVPDPDFLEVALAHLGDARVGFVQSGVAFHNRQESFVARATADQAYDIYGPTSMGMHGSGTAVVWGSHTTFRRAALASIGGYQPGLAEDLHTSMQLHAAGWRSIYVPTVHAQGLVPSDLPGLTTQQLKWARGVFGMLLEVFPRLWRRLAASQRIAYLVRLTYYLLGPVFALHALAILAGLSMGNASQRADLGDYLLRGAPLGVMFVLIRQLANRLWNPQRDALGVKLRGYALACGLWPVYTLALCCAILRVPIPHLSTPKERRGGPRPLLALPQAILIVLLLAAVGWRLAHGCAGVDALLIPVALVAAGVQLTAVHAAAWP